jgi:hypothetical protein
MNDYDLDEAVLDKLEAAVESLGKARFADLTYEELKQALSQLSPEEFFYFKDIVDQLYPDCCPGRILH